MTTSMSSTTRAALGSSCAALLLLAACGGSEGDDGRADGSVSTVEVVSAGADDPSCPTEGEEWETAKLYIEHNATDDDTGVHGLFGGEAWRELCLTDPDGNRIFVVDPRSQLDALAVSDFFFESREPPGDEYSVADLFADFPAGEYTVSGTDFEGTARVGTARFAHAVPAPPEITEPAGLVDDVEEDEPPVVPASGLVVRWEPVVETVDGAPVGISGYEVIVTTEEFDDPDGLSRPVYDVHVPADQTSLAVPDEWLRADTLYELEVLALEESGNQTISVGFFRTA